MDLPAEPRHSPESNAERRDTAEHWAASSSNCRRSTARRSCCGTWTGCPTPKWRRSSTDRRARSRHRSRAGRPCCEPHSKPIAGDATIPAVPPINHSARGTACASVPWRPFHDDVDVAGVGRARPGGRGRTGRAARPGPAVAARSNAARGRAWPMPTRGSTRRSGRCSWPGTAAGCPACRWPATRREFEARFADEIGRPLERVEALPARLARVVVAAARRRPIGARARGPARPLAVRGGRAAQGARDPDRGGSAVRLDRRRDREARGSSGRRDGPRPQPDPAADPVPSRRPERRASSASTRWAGRR